MKRGMGAGARATPRPGGVCGKPLERLPRVSLGPRGAAECGGAPALEVSRWAR